MGATTERSLQDRAGGIRRMIRGLARDPNEWDPDLLDIFTDLQHELSASRDRAVIACRENGATDTDIGRALGITQQAVSKRWPGGGRYVGAAGRYRTTNPITGDR